MKKKKADRPPQTFCGVTKDTESSGFETTMSCLKTERFYTIENTCDVVTSHFKKNVTLSVNSLPTPQIKLIRSDTYSLHQYINFRRSVSDRSAHLFNFSSSENCALTTTLVFGCRREIISNLKFLKLFYSVIPE